LKLSLILLKFVNEVFGNSNESHQDPIKTSPEGDTIIKHEMMIRGLGNPSHDPGAMVLARAAQKG
jgi:hypothetical protein